LRSRGVVIQQRSPYGGVTPFDLSILHDEENITPEELAEMNVLEMNEAMPEYDIPQNIAASIPVTKDEFDDLKKCLLLASGNKNLSLEISIGIVTWIEDSWNQDKIIPVDGEPKKIIEFSWTLSSEDEDEDE